jgi:hypothetical protein
VGRSGVEDGSRSDPAVLEKAPVTVLIFLRMFFDIYIGWEGIRWRRLAVFVWLWVGVVSGSGFGLGWV